MTYSESYFTTRETWRDWRIEARELIRLAHVTHDACVLEIGCGGGGLLRMLRGRGVCAVGVDTLGSALHLARKQLGLETDQETKRKGGKGKNLALSPCHLVALSLVRIDEDGALPFRNDAFDAIIGQHVVEHLPDVDTALHEWKRVLKLGGRLALATPNARYPDPAHFADAEHARVFSPDELRGLITHAGFLTEECFTIFPSFSRVRVLCAVGVLMYRVFQRVPYLATRSRTIMLAARKV